MVFIGLGNIGLDLGLLLLIISVVAILLDSIFVILGEYIEKWEFYSELSLLIGGSSFVVAFLYFSYSILTADYTYTYVISYVSNNMDFFMRISSIWSGQAGSYFFWGFAIMTSYIIFRQNFGQYAHEPIYYRAFIFFSLQVAVFVILTIMSEPFKYSTSIVTDGIGLNPSLMNFWNIIHPPIILLGYALCLTPMVIGLSRISVLKEGKLPNFEGKEKLNTYFDFFVSFAWWIMSAGIIIGAYWAYITLGWGGFWAWDPVETASLIPWLFLTLFYHGKPIYHNKSKFLENYVISMTYIGALFATYLTRSAIITSVHAFSPGGSFETILGLIIPKDSFIISIILRFIPDERILFLFLALLISFLIPHILGFKTKEIKQKHIQLSKEDFQKVKMRTTALKLSYLSFFVGIYVMILGLMFPVIYDIIGYIVTFSQDGFAETVTIGPIFYNTILTFFGGIMLIVQFFCTFYPRWEFRRKLQLLAGGVITGVVFTITGMLYREGILFSILGDQNPIITILANFWTTSDKANLVIPLIFLGIIGLAIEFVNIALKEEKHLMRKTSQTMLHLSILVILLGAITSANMTITSNVELVQEGGEYAVPNTSLTMKILDLRRRFPQTGLHLVEYEVSFLLTSGNRAIGIGLSQLSLDRSNRPDQSVTIISDLLTDIYVVTIATYEDAISGLFMAATLQVKIIPYINILWAGCLILNFAIAPLSVSRFIVLRQLISKENSEKKENEKEGSENEGGIIG